WKFDSVARRSGSARAGIGEQSNRIDGKSISLQQNGAVGEHPKRKVVQILALCLMLQVNDEESFLPVESSLHHKVGLATIPLGPFGEHLFVQKLHAGAIQRAGKFRQEKFEKFEEKGAQK